MRKAASGAFPLNMSYNLVRKFDGPNDGLVGEPSFKWGEDYKLITNTKKQGIYSIGALVADQQEKYSLFTGSFYKITVKTRKTLSPLYS